MLYFFPFPVLAVRTDNGFEYLKAFDKELEDKGIEHYFSHPNCPKENARVERKIQSDKYELWAYREGYTVVELNRSVSTIMRHLPAQFSVAPPRFPLLVPAC